MPVSLLLTINFLFINLINCQKTVFFDILINKLEQIVDKLINKYSIKFVKNLV